jgi:hypothetical protein
MFRQYGRYAAMLVPSIKSGGKLTRKFGQTEPATGTQLALNLDATSVPYLGARKAPYASLSGNRRKEAWTCGL